MLALLFLLTACKPHQLAWVEDADAEKMVASDTAQGRLRFFSVCGYACSVPGVSDLNAKMCYSKAVVEIIAGTGDVINSNEEERLNIKAGEFAERYNLLVKSYLRREKQSQCDPSTNWDSGFYAMHQYVQSLNEDVREAGQVAFIAERAEFAVKLPSTVPIQQASPALCKLITSNGLVGVATVKLSHRDKPDSAATVLDCTDG